MKNGETYFKWLVILIGIIVVFLLFRRCNGNGSGQPLKGDTIMINKDSIITHYKHDTTYIPSLVKEYIPSIKEVHDTLEVFENMNIDTAFILRDYLTTRRYVDTQTIAQGKIIIEDFIFKNKILKRRLVADIKTTDYTTTITKEKKKIIGYAGITAIGSERQFLYAVGLTAGIKAKNDKYYGIGALLTRDGNVMYQATINIPIKLK